MEMKSNQEMAAYFTAKAAEIKDWRLRRKSDRELKKIAVELAKGDGYIIASEKEMKEKYPEFTKGFNDDDTEGLIWCIDINLRGLQRLSIVPCGRLPEISKKS